jgi:hypothetical protein
MTTVKTRVREISNKEEFDLLVTRNGKPIRPTRNGVLKSAWPHRNQTRDTHSVTDFREKFKKAYPGYSCDVLEGDGSKTHGNTKLKQVRATY